MDFVVSMTALFAHNKVERDRFCELVKRSGIACKRNDGEHLHFKKMAN